jgi:general stress protein 26
MSDHFSNTNVGDKNADPYRAKNEDEPGLQQKVEDLVRFIAGCKFGMMTTRIASSGLLTSRCMALAATVSWNSLVAVLACNCSTPQAVSLPLT